MRSRRDRASLIGNCRSTRERSGEVVDPQGRHPLQPGHQGADDVPRDSRRDRRRVHARRAPRQPGAVVAAAHVHPSQTETFEILEGRIAAKVDGEAIEAGAGDVLVVEPGQAHKWWNAGESELVFRTEIRPPLEFERLIETMFSLATDGKTNRKGLPNPLRLAVIASHHLDDVVLPFPPVVLQKLGLALAAPLGRLAGYRPTYAATSLRPAYAH
jgi:quercetin dioxygenase-like cupin family protein